MKKSYLFSMALAAALFAGCSSENITVSDGGVKDAFGNDGKAYVNLAITLPTTQGTRANGEFDDGDADEYNVANAALVIFAGQSEADATLASAYKLNPSFVKDPSTDQVTTTAKIVQFINDANLDETDLLYAYVMLNYEGSEFAVTDQNGLTYSGASLVGTKFSDFQKKTLAGYKDKEGVNFVMTNAPVAHSQGGSVVPVVDATKPNGSVTTLSLLDASKIYKTKAEALQNPATEVFVERVAAKVTLTGYNSALVDDNDPNKTIEYKIKGWTIDNYNPTSYVNRNIAATAPWLVYANEKATANKYRMVDANEIRKGSYRTYWGEDMNYDQTGVGTLVNVADKYAYDATWNATGKNAYCHENTFDLSFQNWAQTTRVVVAAEFNGGEDFYTISSEGSDVIYEKDDVEKYIKGKVLAMTDVKDWLSTVTDALYQAGTVPAGKKVTLGEGNVTVTLAATQDGTNQFDEAYRLERGQVFATVDIKSVTVDGADIVIPAGLADATKTLEANIGKFFKSTLDFYLYKNGIAYYPVRIKHFGDVHTPWSSEPGMNDTNESVYKGDAKSYLGRYGVVRNNWYKINVMGIKHIGGATVPELNDKPDDTPDEGYISVQINVLPWALRVDDVVL